MKTLRPFFKVTYYLLWVFLAAPVLLIFRMRVIGRENLIRDRGFIIAPNHLRVLDPMYVLLARGFKKKALVMGKDELFRIHPLLNWLFYIFGAFPVNRGEGNRELLNTIATEVQKGRGLLMFPEGTRSKDGKFSKPKSGAFVVAQVANVDITPCLVHYNGKKWPHRYVDIVFGKPVSLDDLGFGGEESDAQKLRTAKRRYTAIMENLLEENRSVLGIKPVKEDTADEGK